MTYRRALAALLTIIAFSSNAQEPTTGPHVDAGGPAFEALLAAFNEEAYKELHGVSNPSLDLLHSLADAGVKFYACGQSLGFRGLDKSVLAEPVQVGLSAMTMLVTLQSDGYAFLP